MTQSTCPESGNKHYRPTGIDKWFVDMVVYSPKTKAFERVVKVNTRRRRARSEVIK